MKGFCDVGLKLYFKLTRKCYAMCGPLIPHQPIRRVRHNFNALSSEFNIAPFFIFKKIRKGWLSLSVSMTILLRGAFSRFRHLQAGQCIIFFSYPSPLFHSLCQALQLSTGMIYRKLLFEYFMCRLMKNKFFDSVFNVTTAAMFTVIGK